MAGFSNIVCLATELEEERAKHSGTMFAMSEPAIEPFTAHIGKELNQHLLLFLSMYDNPNYYAIYNLGRSCICSFLVSFK